MIHKVILRRISEELTTELPVIVGSNDLTIEMLSIEVRASGELALQIKEHHEDYDTEPMLEAIDSDDEWTIWDEIDISPTDWYMGNF